MANVVSRASKRLRTCLPFSFFVTVIGPGQGPTCARGSPVSRRRPSGTHGRRWAKACWTCGAVTAFVTLDAEPPALLVMAQTLVHNRQSNHCIELHALYLLPLATTDKGLSMAQFCAVATRPPGRLTWCIIPSPLTPLTAGRHPPQSECLQPNGISPRKTSGCGPFERTGGELSTGDNMPFCNRVTERKRLLAN